MSGLTATEVKAFWNARAERYGLSATGPVSASQAQQDLDYSARRAWLIPRIGPDILTRDVLDFGCGTGRYAEIWQGEYEGVDISGEMLSLARTHLPSKKFNAIADPWLPAGTGIECSVFFSATVLQHCDDDLLNKVFDSCGRLELSTFVLYENSEQMGGFMRGRTSLEYVQVLEKIGCTVRSFQSWSHVFHTSRHTLTVVHV